MDVHGVAQGMPIPIPKQLIYEELDGQIFYRKGYKDVLNQTKTIEEIIGRSSLESMILSLFVRHLYRNLDEGKYAIMTNQVGLNISLENQLVCDIALYPIKMVLDYQLDEYYFNIPPKIVIEVDIAIDLEHIADYKYVSKKLQALFKFGVERVLWIFTYEQKILIAEPNQDWILRDWAKDVQLMEGHTFNLMQRIQKKGYKI
jgi:Uma2 family endonuclease